MALSAPAHQTVQDLGVFVFRPRDRWRCRPLHIRQSRTSASSSSGHETDGAVGPCTSDSPGPRRLRLQATRQMALSAPAHQTVQDLGVFVFRPRDRWRCRPLHIRQSRTSASSSSGHETDGAVGPCTSDSPGPRRLRLQATRQMALSAPAHQTVQDLGVFVFRPRDRWRCRPLHIRQSRTSASSSSGHETDGAVGPCTSDSPGPRRLRLQATRQMALSAPAHQTVQDLGVFVFRPRDRWRCRPLHIRQSRTSASSSSGHETDGAVGPCTSDSPGPRRLRLQATRQMALSAPAHQTVQDLGVFVFRPRDRWRCRPLHIRQSRTSASSSSGHETDGAVGSCTSVLASPAPGHDCANGICRL
ncbi:hypothetical protein ACOMHN_005441 [Nucella lapillus]